MLVDKAWHMPGELGERTQWWMTRFRKLLIRFERKVQNYLALLHLACAYITARSAGGCGRAVGLPVRAAV